MTKDLDSALANARAHLGEIDRGLDSLLERRFEIVRRIGLLKASLGLPIRDLRREADRRARCPAVSAGTASALRAAASAITSISIREQADALLREGAFTRIGEDLEIIASPCAVESQDSLDRSADAAREAGADMLGCGGSGPELEGICMLRRTADRLGMPLVGEVIHGRNLSRSIDRIDILQIGAGNMQNLGLLSEVARCGKPVILDRGTAATLEEVVHAVGSLRERGCRKIFLCERGMRTACEETRATLDISAIPILKAWTGCPVFANPSHAAGYREWVEPLALSAVAAGADGLLVEMHHDPDRARGDSRRTLWPSQLARLVRSCRAIRRALCNGSGGDISASGMSPEIPSSRPVRTRSRSSPSCFCP